MKQKQTMKIKDKIIFHFSTQVLTQIVPWEYLNSIVTETAVSIGPVNISPQTTPAVIAFNSRRRMMNGGSNTPQIRSHNVKCRTSQNNSGVISKEQRCSALITTKNKHRALKRTNTFFFRDNLKELSKIC